MCFTHPLIADATLFMRLFVIYYGGKCPFDEFKNVICLHLLLFDIEFIFCITFLYASLLMFSVYKGR